MFNGTITQKQMNTPKFQRKIGTLYDSSVDHQALRMDSYLSKNVPQSSLSSRQGINGSRSAKGYPKKSGVPISGSGTPLKSPRSAKSTPRGEVEQVPSLQRKLSDVLLQLLMKGMGVDDSKTVENNDALAASTKRSISTNTEIDEDLDDWAWMAKSPVTKFTRGRSSTTVEDLTTPWIRNSESKGVGAEAFQDIKNCFIYEGKICPLEAAKKPVSSFAPLSESRR